MYWAAAPRIAEHVITPTAARCWPITCRELNPTTATGEGPIPAWVDCAAIDANDQFLCFQSLNPKYHYTLIMVKSQAMGR